ncbi:MAG: hypothetical protein J6U51_03375 [Bacteroidales bacterium]|nr:hypothetical protein [Bacteroidales bacterium]
MDILNEFEQAALFYYVYSETKDKKLVFQLAKGSEYYNRLTDKSKKTTLHNWFKSEPVKNYIKKLEFQKELDRQQNEKNIIDRVKTEAIEPGQTQPNPENVNFLDRDQFLEYLNKKANSQTDEKLQNETLKMLSDNLRYKDGDNETTEIQRFYTPICCKDCEIYKKCSVCSGCSGLNSGK